MSTTNVNRWGDHFMMVCYTCGGRPATYLTLGNYPRTTCIQGGHAIGQVACCRVHDEIGDCQYCRQENVWADQGRPDMVYPRMDPQYKQDA